MRVTKVGALMPAETVSPSCVETWAITPSIGAVSVAKETIACASASEASACFTRASARRTSSST